MSTRARRCGLVVAQAGCAALAFSTAAATSALEANATLARTSPVIGWKTSPSRPLPPLTRLPPMKWPYSIMALLPKSAVLLEACATTQPPDPASARPLSLVGTPAANANHVLRLSKDGRARIAVVRLAHH